MTATRYSEEWLAGYRQRQAAVVAAPTAEPAKPRKYGNVVCEADGQHFDSKLELRRYFVLKTLKAAGQVLWFTRQVPFYLPGGVRYVADFLEVYADGRVWVTDCKGFDTPISKLKRKQVLEVHGVEVRILRRGDV